MSEETLERARQQVQHAQRYSNGNFADGRDALISELLSLCESLQSDKSQLESVLVSKHGGEPLALLAELDACRADLCYLATEAIRKRLTPQSTQRRRRGSERPQGC
jgi:hypothetical protein